MKKIFVLGVGAQKSGTTWFWHYLKSRRDFDVGFTKEYHTFDTITLPECFWIRKTVEDRVSNLLRQGYDAWRDSPFVKRLNFMSDTQSYFSYFADILGQSSVKGSCDISPSYAALSVETLSLIRDEFQKRGIDVRPVYFVREPIDRLRSRVDMRFRNLKIVPTHAELLKMMKEKCGTPNDDLIRSNYAKTISNLDEVFGDKKYIGFYEELFTEKSISAICDYLDVPYQPAELDVK